LSRGEEDLSGRGPDGRANGRGGGTGRMGKYLTEGGESQDVESLVCFSGA